MVQMRKIGFMSALFAFALVGCFKDQPKLPQYYAKQHIDIASDTLICYSALEDFDHFIVTNSLPLDSIHWFSNYSNGQGNYLGNDTFIAVEPEIWSNQNIGCIGYLNNAETEFVVQFYYCGRNIFIPTAFSVFKDGRNDTWYPIVNGSGINNSYSIYWEIRTLDGIKIYESSDPETGSNGWDGLYNGYLMPRGSYLFYIELTFQGEKPVEYTGWLEMRE